MAYRKPLALDSVFRAHGLIYTVIGRAANGRLVCRIRGTDDVRHFTYREIASAPDFRFADESEIALDPTLDELPESLKAEAEKRIADLNEARTGYRGGDENLALPGEPRPQYDPLVTDLTMRMNTKAAELGIALSTLYERLSKLEKSGAAAVLDGRSTRKSDPLRHLDERVKEAILAVHRERLSKPRITNKLLRHEVQAYLTRDEATADLVVPPQRSFDRYYNILSQGDASGSPTKYQRSRAEGPQGAYGTLAPDISGDFVLVDESPTNVWTVDPITLEVVQPILVLAMDAYSRSILAARFVTHRPNQVDACSLLRDIVTPKPFHDEWPGEAHWHYVGVPEHIVIAASNSSADKLAHVPAITPTSVVTDNAWIYKSRAFRDAADLLDIDVIYAREFTPTDKASIESTFGTINENFFAAQPGYKGRDVASGADARREAQRFLEELELDFWEWVVRYWQTRQHRGLHFGCAPRLGLTPNDVYEESLARVGFMPLPLSRDIYFDLLPRKPLEISREGIKFRTLTYDCPRENDLLKPFRDQKSPYPQFGHKWPIRFDDRDLRVVYLQDPKTDEWLCIPWKEAHLFNQPFGSDTHDFAVDLAKSRGRHPADVEHVIKEMLERRDAHAPMRGKELAAAKRQHARDQQLARDRAGAIAKGMPTTDPRKDDGDRPDCANGNGNGRLRTLDQIPKLAALIDPTSEEPT